MRKLNTVLELLFLILETTIFPPSMRIGYTFSGLREEIQEEFQDHVLRQEKTLKQLVPASMLRLLLSLWLTRAKNADPRYLAYLHPSLVCLDFQIRTADLIHKE